MGMSSIKLDINCILINWNELDSNTYTMYVAVGFMCLFTCARQTFYVTGGRSHVFGG